MQSSAKKFEREAKNAQKMKNINLKKAEASLRKGDEDGARLFTGTA